MRKSNSFFQSEKNTIMGLEIWKILYLNSIIDLKSCLGALNLSSEHFKFFRNLQIYESPKKK